MPNIPLNIARMDWVVQFVQSGKYWIGTNKDFYIKFKPEFDDLFMSTNEMGIFFNQHKEQLQTMGIVYFMYKQHSPQARCFVLCQARDEKVLAEYSKIADRKPGRPRKYEVIDE